MGILDQAISGSTFKRKQTSLSTSPKSGSTAAFDTSYILLGISAQSPCRVRLYSDQSSRDTDDSRASSSFAFASTVGVVLDTELDASQLNFTFDPPIIGTSFPRGQTWYNISSSAVQNISFTSYPIEFSTSPVRGKIEVSGSNIPSGSFVFGNTYTPRSFIILSGSSTEVIRLRLYSKDINLVPITEKTRAFGTEPATGSYLIADMAFDTPSVSNKFVPILEAYNLDTYNSGSNFVGYILENISTSTVTSVTTSLCIYSTED